MYQTVSLRFIVCSASGAHLYIPKISKLVSKSQFPPRRRKGSHHIRQVKNHIIHHTSNIVHSFTVNIVHSKLLTHIIIQFAPFLFGWSPDFALSFAGVKRSYIRFLMFQFFAWRNV